MWLARRLGTLGGLGQRHGWYPKLRAIVDELAAADFENPAGVVGLDAVDGGVDPLGHLVLDVFRARPAGDDGIEAVEFLAAGLVDGGLIEEIPLVLPDGRAVGAGGISPARASSVPLGWR